MIPIRFFQRSSLSWTRKKSQLSLIRKQRESVINRHEKNTSRFLFCCFFFRVSFCFCFFFYPACRLCLLYSLFFSTSFFSSLGVCFVFLVLKRLFVNQVLCACFYENSVYNLSNNTIIFARNATTAAVRGIPRGSRPHAPFVIDPS